MVDKRVTNINVRFSAYFEITIECERCRSAFNTTVDGRSDRRKIRCEECGFMNPPKSVIKSIIRQNSDRPNYSLQNNNNRSLSVTRDNKSFMLWGTGSLSSTGKFKIEKRKEFVELCIKQLFKKNAKIVGSELSNISIILDMGKAIDLRGMYKKLKNEDSSRIDNLEIGSDSIGGFQSLSMNYKDSTHISIFSTGKIKVSTDDLEVADTVYTDISRYIEDNFSQIVNAPPKMKEKESMYMFGESSGLELSEYDREVLIRESKNKD